MLAFDWEYLSLFDDPVKKKKTGRCLLLGMCASTELGGNITPLGSSINIMVINFLNDCGFSISYAKWIGISLPLFVILFFLMTRILFRMCPPEALSQPKIQECIAANQTLRPLSAKEKKLLAIVSVMMVLLLISPFIPELKSELIIVAAAVPSVLTVPMITFCASVNIDPVLAVIPLAMCSNGSWILPLDPISLLTYGKGYYTLMDMVKPGLVLTAMTAAVTGGWMALLSLLL